MSSPIVLKNPDVSTVSISIITEIDEPTQSHAPMVHRDMNLSDESEIDNCCKVCCSDCKLFAGGIFCCFVNSWSCILNSIEGCCFGCSGMCICLSKSALLCRACLEKIDCDKT